MKKLSRKKGFTLVELIIAMAILVIVSGGIGLAVETSSSLYAQNTSDLKSTEYTDKILEYYKGKQLSGLDSIYRGNSAGTEFFYLYFNNDDPTDNTVNSLNYVLPASTGTNKPPIFNLTSSGNTPDYAGCSSNNTSNYKYGVIVTLTKNYDNAGATAAENYNFYTYKIDVTLYDFEKGQNVQSELNVLVSR